jgi:hypothetical protein
VKGIIYRFAFHPKIISLFYQGNRERPNKEFQPILRLFLTYRTIYAEAYKPFSSRTTMKCMRIVKEKKAEE